MEMFELVDTHAHLYAVEFDNDREEIIQKSISIGISKFFLPNCDSATVAPLLTLAKKFPDHCFPMVGLHPCSVGANFRDELSVLEKYLHTEKIYAIGEIGIDLYWDKTYIREQEEAFIRQIEWSIDYGLPIVIHSRNSYDAIYPILKQYSSKLKPGIFHCFSGNLEQAQQIIDLGFYLGIGGVVTFKNAGIDHVVKELDLKHIVLETDSPYLAPVPYRGKRNDSSYLLLIAQKIADLKETSIQTVAKITSANAMQVFQM